MKYPKKTIILEYQEHGEGFIPIIECEERKDYIGGLTFYCAFCRKNHYHGEGEGHRTAHCHDPRSPFDRTGYILRMRR